MDHNLDHAHFYIHEANAHVTAANLKMLMEGVNVGLHPSSIIRSVTFPSFRKWILEFINPKTCSNEGGSTPQDI